MASRQTPFLTLQDRQQHREKKGERKRGKGKEGTEDGATEKREGGKQQEAAAAARETTLSAGPFFFRFPLSPECSGFARVLSLPVLEMKAESSSVGDPRESASPYLESDGGWRGRCRCKNWNKETSERTSHPETKKIASTSLVCLLLPRASPLLPLCSPPAPRFPFWFVFFFVFTSKWIARRKQPALALQERSFDVNQKTFLLNLLFSFLRRARGRKEERGGGTKSIVLRTGAVVALRVLLLKTEHTTQN